MIDEQSIHDDTCWCDDCWRHWTAQEKAGAAIGVVDRAEAGERARTLQAPTWRLRLAQPDAEVGCE